MSESENAIFKVFNYCQSLESVVYRCDEGSHRGMCSLLHGIEEVLSQNKLIKRKTMKIRIADNGNIGRVINRERI